MIFERITTIIELILFGLIVVQGEYIRYYERGVHRIQSERETERRAWREQKRKQSSKKTESTSTSTATSETSKDAVQ